MTDSRKTMNALKNVVAACNRTFADKEIEFIAHRDPNTKEFVVSTARYENGVLVSVAKEQMRNECPMQLQDVLSGIMHQSKYVMFTLGYENRPDLDCDKFSVAVKNVRNWVANNEKMPTKREKFAVMVQRNKELSRKEIIELAITELNMTKAGASTYWANFKKDK